MQKAVSTITGNDVWAEEFARRPRDEVDSQRRNFVCDGCGCPAHLREPTIRVPHFAGRGHEDDCTLLRDPNADVWENGGEQVVQRMLRNRTKIVLMLPQAPNGDGTDGAGGALQTEPRNDTRRGPGGARAEVNSTRWRRGLQTLLKMVVQSNVFRTSVVPIVLPDGSEVPTNEFFVAFEMASPDQHQGLYRAYWGVPANIRAWQSPDDRYVNTVHGRHADKLSFYIGPTMTGPVAQALRLPSVDDLAGRYVLFLGAPTVTGRSAKFQLTVTEPRHIAVRPGPRPRRRATPPLPTMTG